MVSTENSSLLSRWMLNCQTVAHRSKCPLNGNNLMYYLFIVRSLPFKVKCDCFLEIPWISDPYSVSVATAGIPWKCSSGHVAWTVCMIRSQVIPILGPITLGRPGIRQPAGDRLVFFFNCPDVSAGR